MPVAGTRPKTPIAALATTEESLRSSTTEATPAEEGRQRTCFRTHHWIRKPNSQLSNLFPVLRFDHGGFGGGGGGNSRWVEESRDDGDWSKPLPRNERLEQWVWRNNYTSCGRGGVPGFLWQRPVAELSYISSAVERFKDMWIFFWDQSGPVSAVSCSPAATPGSTLRNTTTFPLRLQDKTALITSRVYAAAAHIKSDVNQDPSTSGRV